PEWALPPSHGAPAGGSGAGEAEGVAASEGTSGGGERGGVEEPATPSAVFGAGFSGAAATSCRGRDGDSAGIAGVSTSASSSGAGERCDARPYHAMYKGTAMALPARAVRVRGKRRARGGWAG